MLVTHFIIHVVLKLGAWEEDNCMRQVVLPWGNFEKEDAF
jgi:hypothetical protein